MQRAVAPGGAVAGDDVDDAVATIGVVTATVEVVDALVVVVVGAAVVVTVGAAVVVAATLVVAGGGGGGAGVVGAGTAGVSHCATPPWWEQVPEWVCEKL